VNVQKLHGFYLQITNLLGYPFVRFCLLEDRFYFYRALAAVHRSLFGSQQLSHSFLMTVQMVADFYPAVSLCFVA
jgi:hypothetical protein